MRIFTSLFCVSMSGGRCFFETPRGESDSNFGMSNLFITEQQFDIPKTWQGAWEGTRLAGRVAQNGLGQAQALRATEPRAPPIQFLGHLSLFMVLKWIVFGNGSERYSRT